MAPFGPKPWVNPFGKMSIFRHFELLVFKAQKGVFSFQNFVKDIFWPILSKKKRLEKWPVLDQSQGLTPFEKCQFSDFLHFLFLQPKKAFFRPRIFLNKFYWPILLKKKKMEKWPFLDQNHGLTPLEKFQFVTFFNFLFLLLRKAFFRSRIS